MKEKKWKGINRERWVAIFDFLNDWDKEHNKDIPFLIESGSAIYGTQTPDSDIDLRGVFIENPWKMISLRKPDDCIVSPQGELMDYQIWELEKFLKQLIKPNFNVFEWVYSPNKFIRTIEKDFIKIANKSACRKLGSHARGWCKSIYKMDWNLPKKCMYAIRPMMTYKMLIETREFHSDINIVAKHCGVDGLVAQLQEYNKNGQRVPDAMKDRTHEIYLYLEKHTKALEKDSWLPEQPSEEAYEMANELLLKYRGY